MFCIDNRCTDSPFNLAAEKYLLKRKRENYFMLWQSDPPVASQPLCEDGNIQLTFVEQAERPDFNYYLQQILAFLEEMRVPVYADPQLNIQVDGQRISNCIQCIHKNRVLYHCTLLFSTGAKASGGSVRKSVGGETACLRELLPEQMDVKRFMRLLFHFFLDDEANRVSRFTHEDIKAIEDLR